MNILERAAALIRQDQEAQIFRATVTGTSGNKVTILRVGATTTETIPKLATYSSPVNNDPVIVVRLGKGYVCLGKIVS